MLYLLGPVLTVLHMTASYDDSISGFSSGPGGFANPAWSHHDRRTKAKRLRKVLNPRTTYSSNIIGPLYLFYFFTSFLLNPCFY